MDTSDEQIKLLAEKQDLVEKLYANIKGQENEISQGRIKRLDKYFAEAKVLFEGIKAVDLRLKSFGDQASPPAVKIIELIDQRLREIQEINGRAVVEASGAKDEAEQILIVLRKCKRALKEGYGKTMRPARSNVINRQV